MTYRFPPNWIRHRLLSPSQVRSYFAGMIVIPFTGLNLYQKTVPDRSPDRLSGTGNTIKQRRFRVNCHPHTVEVAGSIPAPPIRLASSLTSSIGPVLETWVNGCPSPDVGSSGGMRCPPATILSYTHS